ncbi:MAG: hypothetical protein M1823_006094 [Watsoniomyces obsoletus]|nr:MAG: hypothetical protein M1823_006094 [Watsoniomyces obsoletus]
MACTSDIFLCLLAILFPPLPVWVKRGICSADSLINIALCMLGGIPGLFHAWYIILKYPDAYQEYSRTLGGDAEGGAVTYYYVRHRPSSEGVRGQYHHHQATTTNPPRHQNYGTTSVVPSMMAPVLEDEGQHHVAGQPGPVGGDGDGGVPPTYEQAVKGDHKIQSDH